MATSPMELNGPSRFRQSKIPSADRFLGTFPLSSPQSDRPSSSTIDELSEDDVFYSADFSSSDPIESVHQNRQPNQSFTPSSSSSSSPNFQLNPKPFANSQNFGILAALRDPSRPQSNFYQKPSISTPSSSASSGTSPSSSRLIPSIPKPPQDRIPISSSLGRYHQSAPVNVPLKQVMRKNRPLEEDFEEEEEEPGEMIPPHVLVARSVAESPALAHSVLEGVGRTLKGRDLRQVRNAIWRQTGFLD